MHMNDSDTIVISCPHCRKRLRVKAAAAGKSGRCPNPNCRQLVTVEDRVVAGGGGPTLPAAASPSLPSPSIIAADVREPGLLEPQRPADQPQSAAVGQVAFGQAKVEMVEIFCPSCWHLFQVDPVSTQGTITCPNDSCAALVDIQQARVFTAKSNAAMLMPSATILEATYSGWLLSIKVQLVCAALSLSIIAVLIIVGQLFGVELERAADESLALFATLSISLIVAAIVCPAIAVLAIVAEGIFFCVLLHRLWQVVQDGCARTTPGKAIGYLFIPFFNLYWCFVVTRGLALELNRVAARRRCDAPPVLSGYMTTFVVLAFLSAVPFLGVVFLIPQLVYRILALRSAKRAAVCISGENARQIASVMPTPDSNSFEDHETSGATSSVPRALADPNRTPVTDEDITSWLNGSATGLSPASAPHGSPSQPGGAEASQASPSRTIQPMKKPRARRDWDSVMATLAGTSPADLPGVDRQKFAEFAAAACEATKASRWKGATGLFVVQWVPLAVYILSNFAGMGLGGTFGCISFGWLALFGCVRFVVLNAKVRKAVTLGNRIGFFQ